MELSEIVAQLDTCEKLPRDALRAASERRAELAPLFIAGIEKYLSGAEDSLSDYQIFFIFHLFGEWRETSAYRPLAHILRLPKDKIDDIFACLVSETSHRVMAAVFDGDPAPLHEIILDASADEFVRWRMCEALAMLARAGKLDREATKSFLRDCFDVFKGQPYSYVWNGWSQSISLLGLVELKPLVQEAFEKGYIETFFDTDFPQFEEELRQALADPNSLPQNGENFTLFGDTIDELALTPEFSEQAPQTQQTLRAAPKATGGQAKPYPGVGRNDPCPCGSGKKYKKCCLQ